MKVLITGATGGIGEALIDILVKNGYEIYALGRNKEKLLKLEKNYPSKIKGFPINLNSENEIEEFLQNFKEDINLLINGAGIGEIGYLEDISYNLLKEMIDINVTALTKFTKFFYDKMVDKGEGTIVNISSTAGFQKGGPLMSVYYGTKAYVNSFTLSLYNEGKEKGVKVIILAPGPTKTNFKGIPEKLSFFEKIYITTPEEVASALLVGIKKDKNIIIPGKINKFLNIFNKFIPLNFQLNSIKKIQEKKLKK